MSLKSMPVGYRFHPTDQELVNHYLWLKNQGSDRHVSNIQEIDLCKHEPWDLPGLLGSESDDQEWYFFGRRDSKYGKSARSNRATKQGYWKPTGKDRYIKSSSKKVIGTKKTLVFYKGRAQRAVRTYWVMHEYRAYADKHNPQAFVLYLLKKKSEEGTEISNSDGADLNRQSISSTMVNHAPYNSPSTPTVLQGSGNLSSSDQTRLSQNWKEQEVSSQAQNYPFDPTYAEDDIDLQAFESCFDGQQPTWEGLERMLPAIPLANVYTNPGPVHTTARYLNVLNVDHGAAHFQNIKLREEAADDIGNASSVFTHTLMTVQDAESGTETDNDVPLSLFKEDATFGGSAYHSDSESSDPEFYNDTISANEALISTKNSDVIEHDVLEAGKGDDKKQISSERVHESEVRNPETRINSEITAQATGKKECSNEVPLKPLLEKALEPARDDYSDESIIRTKSSVIPEAASKSDKMGFIVYAENPRANNGTNYVVNIAIGIFLTAVIAGEVLFSIVT